MRRGTGEAPCPPAGFWEGNGKRQHFVVRLMAKRGQGHLIGWFQGHHGLSSVISSACRRTHLFWTKSSPVLDRITQTSTCVWAVSRPQGNVSGTTDILDCIMVLYYLWHKAWLVFPTHTHQAFHRKMVVSSRAYVITFFAWGGMYVLSSAIRDFYCLLPVWPWLVLQRVAGTFWRIRWWWTGSTWFGRSKVTYGGNLSSCTCRWLFYIVPPIKEISLPPDNVKVNLNTF